MSSGCKSSLGCVDTGDPVRANYKLLYKWPESEVEFVKSMTAGKSGERHNLNSCTNVEERRKRSSCRSVVDSYSCRQLYLRSYTFTKKQTVPEKTRRCLRKVKETAAVLSVFSKSSGGSSANNAANTSTRKKMNAERKRNNDHCASTRQLREITYSALDSILHRLLLCTASIDVVD